MKNVLFPFKTKMIITAILFTLPLTCFAKEIDIDFSNSGSTSITRANIIEVSPSQLSITGQLKRLHATPVSGHLHSYTYSDKGVLLTDSKHKVLGLRSQKGGMQQIPFNLSMENPNRTISRITIEYHYPGHKES